MYINIPVERYDESISRVVDEVADWKTLAFSRNGVDFQDTNIKGCENNWRAIESLSFGAPDRRARTTASTYTRLSSSRPEAIRKVSRGRAEFNLAVTLLPGSIHRNRINRVTPRECHLNFDGRRDATRREATRRKERKPQTRFHFRNDAWLAVETSKQYGGSYLEGSNPLDVFFICIFYGKISIRGWLLIEIMKCIFLESRATNFL